MKQQRNSPTHLVFLTTLIACLSPTIAHGQCPQKVTHLSGTQQVGCHAVSVSIAGSTNSSTSCGYSPYRIGLAASSGSYTFTFNPPVTGVSVNIAALNNNNAGTEEVSFEVNGVFYPITVPGSPDGCQSPAIITPTGTIGAVSGQLASWKDININTSITSIKVENVAISNNPSGTVFSIYFCPACCVTDAGNLAGSPLHLCPGDTAMLSDATETFLESTDILRYILFSDPVDTLGSILATNTVPVFGFDPATMQTGLPYYIAAIAGNNLNGNVDLTDPCLDISNAVEVTWHPRPSVSFSADDPNVCAGACTSVTATFAGTAPFTLTYTTPVGGPVTQTFPANTGTFQVCTPANAAPGSLLVQATSLSDAFCSCQ